MHPGKFPAARDAVKAHNGEALSGTLSTQSSLEFLKSPQILPLSANSLRDQSGDFLVSPKESGKSGCWTQVSDPTVWAVIISMAVLE